MVIGANDEIMVCTTCCKPMAKCECDGSKGLNQLTKEIHKNAVDHGFWEEGRDNFAEKIALIHAEVSEALEEHRAGRENVYFSPSHGAIQSKPEGTAVELIDALIRILDLLATLDVDVDHVVRQKMQYNSSRPYMHDKKY